MKAPARLDDGTRKLEASSVNLSTGGISVQAGGPLELGTLVRITVTLGSATKIETTAEVVRVSGADIGLRFLALDQASLNAIMLAAR